MNAFVPVLIGALLSAAGAPVSAAPAPRAPAPPRSPQAPREPVAPAPPAPPALGHGHGHGPTGPSWVFVEERSGPRLGTEVGRMSPQLRGFFGAPQDAGVLVHRIEPGSAAEAAAVEVGDVIVEVDGHRIERSSDVRAALAGRSGDTVPLVVVRHRKRKTLEASLPSSPSTSGLTVPTIPELPPEVWRQLPPDARQQVQRDLDRAREQLREAERQLQAVPEHSHADQPSPKPEARRRRKARRGHDRGQRSAK